MIAAGRPYPGAVETVNAWAEAGHFIHITSHRHVRAHDATERWLREIGLRSTSSTAPSTRSAAAPRSASTC